MNGVTHSQPISQWSEDSVAAWLGSIGFSQYEQPMKGQHPSSYLLISNLTASKENDVTGDVLCRLDLEFLKEIGVTSIGQRVAILKAVYQLKLAHNESLLPGDYIPPCEHSIAAPVSLILMINFKRKRKKRKT